MNRDQLIALRRQLDVHASDVHGTVTALVTVVRALLDAGIGNVSVTETDDDGSQAS